MEWRIGTSGWQHRGWRGAFYEEGVPQRRWLERYAETFDCVEVNNAFYRLHEGAADPWPSYGDQALKCWVERLHDGWPTGEVFVFFNNDQNAAAIHDAQRLKALV